MSPDSIMPIDWIDGDGPVWHHWSRVSDSNLDLLLNNKIPLRHARPFHSAPHEHCIYLRDPAHTLIAFWHEHLKSGAISFTGTSYREVGHILNSSGTQMSFADYIREVVAPACNAVP